MKTLFYSTMSLVMLVVISCSRPEPDPRSIAPIAQYYVDVSSGYAPLTVEFDGTQSSDSDGSITSYQWDFGDGSSGNGSIVSHTFTSPSVYTVTLTVTDNAGMRGSVSYTITVEEDLPPNASFSADVREGGAPLLVQFNASNSSDNGEIVSYDWDFDDGSNGEGETVNHTFSSTGNYQVTLTVTDNGGLSDTYTMDIEVYIEGSFAPYIRSDLGVGTIDVYIGTTSSNYEQFGTITHIHASGIICGVSDNLPMITLKSGVYYFYAEAENGQWLDEWVTIPENDCLRFEITN